MANSTSLRSDDTRGDTGRLVLRVMLGVLMLFHGIGKLPGPPDFIVGALAKMGLPAFLAYGVYVGEVLAPILVIVGVWTRAGALLMVINMIVAVVLALLPELFKIGPHGGYALEVEAMFLFGALAVALLGAGRFSIGGRYGPFN